MTKHGGSDGRKEDTVGMSKKYAIEILGDDPPEKVDEAYVTYPPPGTPKSSEGSISIPRSDLDLLEPGEWLNDTIIDFYLRYIQVSSIPASSISLTLIQPLFLFGRLAEHKPYDTFFTNTQVLYLLNQHTGGAVRGWEGTNALLHFVFLQAIHHREQGGKR